MSETSLVPQDHNALSVDDGSPEKNVIVDIDNKQNEEGKNNSSSNPLAGSSFLQKCRFAAGMAGYRIIRLSVELLLILRIQELHWDIRDAGLIFLLYSLASVVGSLLLMFFPSLFLGSSPRAWAFLVLTVGAACIGFVLAFNLQNFWGMAILASISAWGTSVWSTNYRTIVNLAFPDSDMGDLSRIAQVFECIGFLLPSICLAIVVSLTNFEVMGQGEADSTWEEDREIFSGSVVRYTASLLGGVAAMFYLLGADLMLRAAQKTRPGNRDTDLSLWEAMKVFLGTPSLLKVFGINAILLAAANIIMATMSLITEHVFGLEPTLLWIAAIGFPLGGILSVVLQLSKNDATDAKSSVTTGSVHLSIFTAFCLVLCPLVAPPNSDQVAKTLLFFFGFVVGLLYSTTFASSVEWWLLGLSSNYDTSFVSRASVLYGIGMQAIIAVVFQVQTTIVDHVLTSEELDDSTSRVSYEAVVFFLPLLIFFLATWLLARSLPYPKDKVLGWPTPTPFDTSFKILMHTASWAGLIPIDIFAFLRFCEFRLSLFSPYLKDRIGAQMGPSVDSETATLSPEGLANHFAGFDALGTKEEWWRSDETELHDILLDNEAALEKRIELVEQATNSIWIVTWAFEECDRLANALIKRAQEGLDVRIIGDGVTLYLGHKKELLTKTHELDALRKLAKGGVELRMLCEWHNKEGKNPYVIGSHRKIFLVDDTWMITGGRNTDEKYFRNQEFHFKDSEVLLRGNFQSTTSTFLETLWSKSKCADQLFQIAQTPGAAEATQNANDDDSSFADSVIGSKYLLDPEVGARDVRAGPVAINSNVSTFMLDHKSGDPNGYDIIYSTLVYLIETSNETVDLLFGMFQLFPELESAIGRAIQERGVRVRLVTNSETTNDIPTYNTVYHRTYVRMLELGAEIYVPDDKFSWKDFVLHHKVAVFDRKAALIGSWNCIGVSVFYDSDYSMVLFSKEGQDNLFDHFENHIEDGTFVPMTSIADDAFQVPALFKYASARGTRQIMEKGF